MASGGHFDRVGKGLGVPRERDWTTLGRGLAYLRKGVGIPWYGGWLTMAGKGFGVPSCGGWSTLVRGLEYRGKGLGVPW